MRKSQIIKLSELHKAKTCWTASLTNYELFGELFGAKNYVKNIVVSTLKCCIK